MQKKRCSADRINRLHEVIKGEDEVTGGYYDALDHEQLWVHACLQISSICFYEKLEKLSTEENQYHIENMVAAVGSSILPKCLRRIKSSKIGL